MKTILISFGLSLMASLAMANSIVLDNKTNYPTQGSASEIGVQWAISAKAVQKANRSIIKRSALSSRFLMMLTQKGKVQLSVPDRARYLRVVVWSDGKQTPDLLTNWVNLIPNKTYVVDQGQLVPRSLVAGAGC